MTYHHLGLLERSQIYSLFQVGFSIRAISKLVKCSPSTISRELWRNRDGRGYPSSQSTCQRTQVLGKTKSEYNKPRIN
jgi:transposase, IS30 family